MNLIIIKSKQLKLKLIINKNSKMRGKQPVKGAIKKKV